MLYPDWFLPAGAQLNCLYINRAAIGGFSLINYWSSTEASGARLLPCSRTSPMAHRILAIRPPLIGLGVYGHLTLNNCKFLIVD